MSESYPTTSETLKSLPNSQDTPPEWWATPGPDELTTTPESLYNARLAELHYKIRMLPDTTNREVVLDPSRPERTTSLANLQDDGKGWKLHLNFDAQNPAKIGAVSSLLSRLDTAGLISTFKVGKGGGAAAQDAGKEATVYVGSKDKTDLLAHFISTELGDVLSAPEGDALVNDIELAPGVMGRFEVQGLDPEFIQYGDGGIPALASETHRVQFAQDEAQRTANAQIVQQMSLQRLTDKYGTYFTGSQPQ